MSEINFNRPVSANTPFVGGANEGQGKEKVEGGKTERQDGTQEISSGLAQILSAVLTTTTEGTGKKGKISDPTSMTNVLTLPSGESDMDIDLAKWLSLLQMEVSEEQLKLAQERIKQLKDLISARCKQQLANIQQSVEDFKKAEEKRKAALITAYATLAVAVAALAAATVCAVLSCGVGVGAVIAAGVAVATAAATVAMLEKPSIMNKLIGAVADVFQAIDPSMSRKDAKKAAQIAMLAITIAITVASMFASFGNPATIASSIGRLIQAATSIASGALGVVSGGINIAATVDNYNAMMGQVELKKIQQFLEKLEQRLADEQDAIQEIMKLLQDCVSGIMQQIKSYDQIETEIFANLGQAMA
jgi:F0F1-type ATP synthase assembly protein I